MLELVGLGTAEPMKFARVFIEPRDHKFLWDWTFRLCRLTDLDILPAHFISAMIDELCDMMRSIQSQQVLFPVITEFEIRVIQKAIAYERGRSCHNRFRDVDWVRRWNKEVAKPLGLKPQPVPGAPEDLSEEEVKVVQAQALGTVVEMALQRARRKARRSSHA